MLEVYNLISTLALVRTSLKSHRHSSDDLSPTITELRNLNRLEGHRIWKDLGSLSFCLQVYKGLDQFF